MNTRKQLLAVSVLIAIITLTTLPAQAAIATPKSASFNQLYVSLLTSGKLNDAQSVLITNNMNSVVATNSPVAGTQRSSIRTYRVDVSGYNSEVAQTDDSPFITAKGTYVRDGIVATNMFPFGTVLKIPSLYGNKIFVVEDRMNSRYQRNVDIWFADKAEALKLGRRTVTIEVLK